MIPLLYMLQTVMDRHIIDTTVWTGYIKTTKSSACSEQYVYVMT